MFSLGTIETENLSALQNNKVSTFQGLCITINGNAIYTRTKCPLKCGVHISEVHNSGDFTVLYFEVLYNLFAVEYLCPHTLCLLNLCWYVCTNVLLASTTL